MALHILVDRQNVVGWVVVLNYMRTPLIHYYIKSSVQPGYMETHPNTPGTMRRNYCSSQFVFLQEILFTPIVMPYIIIDSRNHVEIS